MNTNVFIILSSILIITMVIWLLHIYKLKKTNKTIENKIEITTKRIIHDSNVTIETIALVILLSMFIFLFIFMRINIFNIIKVKSYGFEKVGFYFMYPFVIFLALILIFIIYRLIAIYCGRYYIVKDVLLKKYTMSSIDSEGRSSTNYYFVFEKINKKFNRAISTNYFEYKTAEEHEKYYIIIGTGFAKIYKCDNYIEPNDVIDVNELKHLPYFISIKK